MEATEKAETLSEFQAESTATTSLPSHEEQDALDSKLCGQECFEDSESSPASAILEIIQYLTKQVEPTNHDESVITEGIRKLNCDSVVINDLPNVLEGVAPIVNTVCMDKPDKDVEATEPEDSCRLTNSQPKSLEKKLTIDQMVSSDSNPKILIKRFDANKIRNFPFIDMPRKEPFDRKPRSESNRNTEKVSSKTSNDDMGDFEPPSDAQAELITKQVENYFTDFNIIKDNFLLKHIRRNKEGYVSLKLVSSFRKVKNVTKDWRAVRYSLQHKSKKLSLNEEGTKVKRLEPVMDLEDTCYGKTVLVFSIPLENPTSEDVKKLLSTYGEVVKVTMIMPGSVFPDVCTKRILNCFAEYIRKPFALAEFKEYVAAVNAAENFLVSFEENIKGKLIVAPLLSDAYKSKPNSMSSQGSAKSSASESPLSDCASRRSNASKKRSLNRAEEIGNSDRSTSTTNTRSPNAYNTRKVQSNPSSGYQKKRSSILDARNLPSIIVENSTKPQRSKPQFSKSKESLSDNLWFSRRRQEAMSSIKSPAPLSNNQRLPENVVRLPKGPDGTIGFRKRRMASIPESDESKVDDGKVSIPVVK